MKSSSKGFTLIELLVVIAIIGILSSVVLASLSNARSQGQDAAVKATMAQIGAQAELYYTTTGAGDYIDFFTQPATSNGGLTLVNDINAKNGSAADATASSTAGSMYYIYTGMPSGTGYVCADNEGTVASSTGVIANAITSGRCTR